MILSSFFDAGMLFPGQAPLPSPARPSFFIESLVPRMALLFDAWRLLKQASLRNRDSDSEASLEKQILFLQRFAPDDRQIRLLSFALDEINKSLSCIGDRTLCPGAVGPLIYDLIDTTASFLKDQIAALSSD